MELIAKEESRERNQTYYPSYRVPMAAVEDRLHQTAPVPVLQAGSDGSGHSQPAPTPAPHPVCCVPQAVPHQIFFTTMPTQHNIISPAAPMTTAISPVAAPQVMPVHSPLSLLPARPMTVVPMHLLLPTTQIMVRSPTIAAASSYAPFVDTSGPKQPVRTDTPTSVRAGSERAEAPSSAYASHAASINGASETAPPLSAAQLQIQRLMAEETPASSDGEPEIIVYADKKKIEDSVAMLRQNELGEEDVCRERLPSGQVVYVCRTHKRRFKYRRHLEEHFQTHCEKDRSSLCHMCGKTFRRADHLNRHASIHAQATYPCQLCGVIVQSASMLSRHWKAIHPETQTDDSPIGKRRRSGDDGEDGSCAKRLMGAASAPSSKTYKCSRCQQEFGRQAHLTRHEVIHSGDKPYVCTFCPKSKETGNSKCFNRQDYLQSHLKQQHNNIAMDCEECHKHCETMTELLKHYKTTHGRMKASFLHARPPTLNSAAASSLPALEQDESDYDDEDVTTPTTSSSGALDFGEERFVMPTHNADDEDSDVDVVHTDTAEAGARIMASFKRGRQ